ncbi:unnamed protein product [Fructobacillus cardui]|uniref:helix-turn-helix domain-containing protein n=1 Tax=Fructobacillus cardui TaxID=2893170 RepID=UPI002D9C3D3D|nr:unnamed protein product [Fructobacillus cardui]
MKVLSKTFIDALVVKKARKHLKYKQIGEIVGLSQVTVAKIINGKTRTAQERTFDKLNDWLLEEETK